jgi:hypothetical protein
MSVYRVFLVVSGSKVEIGSYCGDNLQDVFEVDTVRCLIWSAMMAVGENNVSVRIEEEGEQ